MTTPNSITEQLTDFKQELPFVLRSINCLMEDTNALDPDLVLGMLHSERKLVNSLDYLRIPEIVEDIINGYRAKFKVCLTQHYTEKLVPALVKFRASDSLHQGCLEAALGYLYSHVRKMEIRSFSVICIDKKGKSIKASEIVEVEYL